ncbi:DUF5719 family protein [Brachybacterium sp. UNK5269]|uniref:DUF5719 family protein n=1 Tax=Brachybacterium sp. UNK5269 TaxID=3408576 RepID=UPI003BB1506C
MAENADRSEHEDPAAPRAPRRGPARPLLAVAALLPLLLAGGALATTAPPEPGPVARAESASQPGASTRWCHGPLQLPEATLESGPDADLAVTPPTATVTLRSVSVEPASSLLFGTVSGSQTLQEEDGSVRAPTITAADAAGAVLEEESASQDLGLSVQSLGPVAAAPRVSTATSQGGRPVADVVQSTATRAGDFRSLALTRCAEPATEAAFLGVSTAPGDSSVLVLRNPTQRPATASVQVWTEAGPAAMAGRSQVVVAPGEEQRVLLESVIPGQEAVGVQASVLGAPLSMHVQTTERDGLTPGGAEILDPLAPAASEQVMPGVDVAGTAPVLVIANPRGADTTADVEVSGPQGPVDAAALTDLELPAGAVVSTPLAGLPDGTYAVTVRAQEPVTAVTRSVRTGVDLPGDTVGAPVDLTLVTAAPALSSQGVTALPAQGAAGQLTLTATADSAVTVIPLAADGGAGSPLSIDVAAGATATVTSDQLRIGGASAAGISLVPEVPGAVHAGWMQRESDGAGGVLLSALPVLPARAGEESVTVRLGTD